MNNNLLSNSMNWACRTITICAVALSTTLTSCEYDDTDLNSRIDSLEERVTNLEKDLKAQIESLQEMLNGKLTINSCTLDAKTGIYTIVLSNGDVLKVAKAVDGAPVMGVVSENGTYYWTLNGEPMLDASGDKVPVATTPGVRVNTKTNEWEISPDNGKTWLGTGVMATEGSSLFSKVDEDADFVYFTLADGTQLKLAKSTEFRCTVLAGKQYFAAGETRLLKLDMGDVKKSTITKPDGWKVAIENSELKITAPAASNTEAEQSGKVAVIAVASNGQSSISEVNVVIGDAPHTLTIDANMNVSITLAADMNDDWTYDGYYYGVRTLAEFSPEQVIEDIKANTRLYPIKDPVNKPLKDLIGSDPEPGVSYVVYVADSYEGEPDVAENMMFTAVTSIYTKFEVKDITYENAHLTVNAMGASQCWAGVSASGDYNPTTILEDLSSDWGAPEKVQSKYSGLLSNYAGSNSLSPGTEYTVWVIPVIPGKKTNTYTAEDIFTTKVTMTPLKLGDNPTVQIGDVTSTMSEVSALITPGTGTYKFYSAYKTEDEMALIQDEDLLRELVTSSMATATTAPNTYTIKKSNLVPGAKGYFLSVAVDKDGNAGKLQKKKADASPLSFSTQTISGSLVATSFNAGSLKLSGNSDIKAYHYLNITAGQWSWDFSFEGNEETTESLIATAMPDNFLNIQIVDAPAGGADLPLEFTDLMPSEAYLLFAVGIDKDGFPTHMIKVEYTPTIPTASFVTAGSEKWTANYADRPQLSNVKFNGKLLSTLTSLSGFEALTADIAIGPKCAEYWIFANDPDYITGVGVKSKTISMMTQYATAKGSGAQTDFSINESFGDFAVMYVIWKDTDGNYYQYEEFDWKSLLKK